MLEIEEPDLERIIDIAISHTIITYNKAHHAQKSLMASCEDDLRYLNAMIRKYMRRKNSGTNHKG